MYSVQLPFLSLICKTHTYSLKSAALMLETKPLRSIFKTQHISVFKIKDCWI